MSIDKKLLLTTILANKKATTPRWLSGGIAAAHCIAAYEPKGKGSLALSYVNQAHPGTNDAAPGVAPTLVANGWQGDGSSKYLTTGITPTLGQTWSYIVKVVGGTTGSIFGNINGATSRFGIWYFSNSVGYDNGGTLSEGTVPASAILGVTGNKGYRNGIATTGNIGDGTGATLTMYILCRYNGTAANFFFDGVISVLYIYDINIATYYAALNTAIGTV